MSTCPLWNVTQLWWNDLRWVPDAYPAALSLPILNRTWEKIRRKRWQVEINTVEYENQKLHVEAKQKSICSPLPICSQMTCHFLESPASVCMGLVGKANTITTNVSALSHFSSSFYCWACCTVWNIPLISLGQLSVLCPIPTFYPPPCLLAFVMDAVGEETLMLSQHSSALAKTSKHLVRYQHGLIHNCKAQCRLVQRKLTSCQVEAQNRV